MKKLGSREWVLLTIIIGLICFGIGYSIGYMSALNWSVEKALWFMKMEGIDVSLNKGLIIQGLWQYKNRIGDPDAFNVSKSGY